MNNLFARAILKGESAAFRTIIGRQRQVPPPTPTMASGRLLPPELANILDLADRSQDPYQDPNHYWKGPVLWVHLDRTYKNRIVGNNRSRRGPPI